MIFWPNVLRGVILTSLIACGHSANVDPDDASVGGDTGTVADVLPGDGASTDAPVGNPIDAPLPIDAAPAFPAVLDVRINCRNDCVLIANPSMIAVPEGTSFEVNWINVGDTECDVAKIDQFNQVPIIIGLEPGTSYHDDVRKWCGQFTGTFEFRVSICTLHSFIPVDCGG